MTRLPVPLSTRIVLLVAKAAGILLAALVVVGIVYLIAVGPDAGEDGRSAVEASGFTEVNMGRPDRMRCGDDWSSATFTATAQNGKRVRGVVCCGMACKGCTVRVLP